MGGDAFTHTIVLAMLLQRVAADAEQHAASGCVTSDSSVPSAPCRACALASMCKSWQVSQLLVQLPVLPMLRQKLQSAIESKLQTAASMLTTLLATAGAVPRPFVLVQPCDGMFASALRPPPACDAHVDPAPLPPRYCWQYCPRHEAASTSLTAPPALRALHDSVSHARASCLASNAPCMLLLLLRDADMLHSRREGHEEDAASAAGWDAFRLLAATWACITCICTYADTVDASVRPAVSLLSLLEVVHPSLLHPSALPLVRPTACTTVCACGAALQDLVECHCAASQWRFHIESRLDAAPPPPAAADVCTAALYYMQHSFEWPRTSSEGILWLRVAHAQSITTASAPVHSPNPSDADEALTWPRRVLGMESIKAALLQRVLLPCAAAWGHLGARFSSYAHAMASMHIRAPVGVILHGPSGCGKSLLARAMPEVLRSRVLVVQCPQLLSKYVGDSEASVRAVFAAARACSPCVLLLDEVHVIAQRRGAQRGSTSEVTVTDRMLSTLLNEMDGVGLRAPASSDAVVAAPRVLVAGTTPSLEQLDAAALRPGRFEHHVHVPRPDAAERALVAHAALAAQGTSKAVAVDALAARSEGWSTSALLREVGVIHER